MKFGSIVSFLMIVVGFSGCYIGAPSYEVFKENRDFFLTPTNSLAILTPYNRANLREVYDENRYIYKFEHPKGCHYGYLTNKDDKPEVIQEWIILSGKEHCKQRQAWACCF
ncbi:hypothetical protein [Campylobacter mucosalis]|uniref:Lipoprotein n=1 Tax=Campylobacter mucosalis CCUG 21559 TaxID=1032067 RepID=A0A6G5QJ80_9BACT|nr:hypothetical protein [Campylobacter mucosalis]QCD45672.1 hypothetical protein CMUC_1931 [Campylobacter mucosalis CCUG 21559]